MLLDAQSHFQRVCSPRQVKMISRRRFLLHMHRFKGTILMLKVKVRKKLQSGLFVDDDLGTEHSRFGPRFFLIL